MTRNSCWTPSFPPRADQAHESEEIKEEVTHEAGSGEKARNLHAPDGHTLRSPENHARYATYGGNK